MFKLVTDSTADLPQEFLQEHNVGCLAFSYIMDGKRYGADRELRPQEFYNAMRAGRMPTTSQVNPEEIKLFFTEMLKESREILYLAFSSGLSGSFNNARLAAEEMMEEQPDCRIIVLDTLAASMGEGLMVYKAVQLRDAGKSMDETASWITEHVQNFVHVFTVDDLFHLYRGGRVSKTAAVLGTMAGIKPILHVDAEGHLINIDKVRGRKKSLMTLVNYMEEKTRGYEEGNEIIMITHGDALKDAEYLRDQIKARLGIENCIINMLGPVIGAHTGPGLIALFFMGESR